jgi:hypothetical protein
LPKPSASVIRKALKAPSIEIAPTFNKVDRGFGFGEKRNTREKTSLRIR